MYKAIHLPGGNIFSNIKIDIIKSFADQEIWLSKVKKESHANSLLRNYSRLWVDRVLMKTRINEPLVMTGVIKYWFDEFCDYWINVLGARPITVIDFHNLRFLYRYSNQITGAMSWESNSQHVENWAKEENISFIFVDCYKFALHPISNMYLFSRLKKNARVLEFGCSLAPMYRTYRRYYDHVQAKWVLADLPNFPYHYARYAYAKDPAIEKMVVIDEKKFDDPLEGVEGKFDVIIMQQVFEHLHKPKYIAEYMLNRLNEGGVLLFDYVISDAQGLDTISGYEDRAPTIEYLKNNLKLLHGSFGDATTPTGVCLGGKI